MSFSKILEGVRGRVLGAIRWAYRTTPLPVAAKQRIKHVVQRHFPGTRGIVQGANSSKSAASLLSFRGFLIESLFYPELNYPLDERSSYYVAFMSGYKKYLENQYENCEDENLVSIIMPSYNRAHCIGDAINSVVSQTYQNWELLIIDDGGTDETEAVSRSFSDPRIRYIRLESNGGQAGARNVGLTHAHGDFVCYLDSDNTMDRSFIKILVNELALNAECDIVYCAQSVSQSSGENRREMFIRFSTFHRPSLENRNYIDLGTIMHRTSILRDRTPFNEDMKMLEDWMFILEITKEKPAWSVPVFLSHYTVGKSNDQISYSLYEETVETKKSIEKYLKADLLSEKINNISIPGFEQMYSLPFYVPEPQARRKISIIIPSFEAEAYLELCIESIFLFSNENDIEIIIVDNGSSQPVLDYLARLENDGSAKVLYNDHNLGFTFAVNQGISAAQPDRDIVIMNNDAVVTRGWLDALQSVLDRHPDAGLVVPSQVVLANQPTLLIHQPGKDVTRECDVNISAHHANVIDPRFDPSCGYMSLSYAPFFCVYLPRATLRLLGPLDVENGPHYRSDCLYCDMITQFARRPIIYTPYSKVYHFVQQATTDLRKRDNALYDDMFVKNDWKSVSTHAGHPQ